MEPAFFADAAALRAWLEEHHADHDELWIRFRKKTGRSPQGLSYSDALDEVLCFGWIDGIRKAAGEGRYAMRLTPRKPGEFAPPFRFSTSKPRQPGRVPAKRREA